MRAGRHAQAIPVHLINTYHSYAFLRSLEGSKLCGGYDKQKPKTEQQRKTKKSF